MNKHAKFISLAAGLAILLPALVFAQSNDTNTNTNSGLAPLTTKIVRAGHLTGTVTSVNGSTITLTVGKSATVYTVDTTNAKFVRRFGAVMLLTDIQTGDQVWASWDKGGLNDKAITAKLIRDLSLQAHNGTFTGTVQSVSTSSFQLQSKNRGLQTINTDSQTVFKKNGQTAQFSDLAQGQTVVVNGVWDRTNSNVTAKTVNIKIKPVKITVTGTIASISGTTLTVTGSDAITYTVDASKARLMGKNGGRPTLSQFNTGDGVQVMGTVGTTTNSIMARTVRDTSLTVQTLSSQNLKGKGHGGNGGAGTGSSY